VIDLAAGLTFGAPWALLLLGLLPAWWYWRSRRRPAAIVFSRTATLARGPRAGRIIGKTLFVLRNLLLIALIVSLARPRSGARTQTITSEGINIAIAVDISSSMLAQDFLPQNRLEVAKETAKNFVLGRKGDRIAIVAFAGDALTQVPLTADYPVIQVALDNLAPAGGAIDDGTAIGTAIATAANRLRRAPGGASVLILLTDGENNRGEIDPRTAAQAAGAFDIRIYTIGIGTEGMAPMPVGRGAMGIRYENRPVRIDEPMLREIAANTGGRYFRARDAAALASIYEQIDVLERVPVQTQVYVRYTERFRWVLSVAMAAFLLELGLLAWRGPLP
jgi:Ca-activated chloride channel homolog